MYISILLSSFLPPMPIVEKAPWRQQYFDDVACPDGVTIPTDDELAYRLYPVHRWIYPKLQIGDGANRSPSRRATVRSTSPSGANGRMRVSV